MRQLVNALLTCAYQGTVNSSDDTFNSAKELADYWRVPVIAHPLEMPYLTGQAL